ncbi:uncharacterized protein LOC132467527 [Gadus macrocephalus]|uniref:uncharacterized protein LOC132467527 n=1 Tax=Gadus macrocephalus TaxID=80720 RepID=UPI0028CBB676|nr:uncharacterized protein LOC132467527 [Gadus macrocephalus]
MFDSVLSVVGPKIARQDTTYRQAISPAERLAICLRYLATGDSYKSLGYSFRVGVSTISRIVPEVANAIWDGFVSTHMQMPKEEEWRAIAEEFEKEWDFPNCIGAIDGKHVTIRAPPCSGSMYHNYKGTFSIVLLAVVDANYCFRMVDVGAYGKGSDGGTLRASAFGKALQGARLVVECAFGILASRFRMYYRVMGQNPEHVEACVKATCILHNLLRSTEATRPSSDEAVPLEGGRRLGTNNSTKEVMQERERFMTYFNSAAGEVSWQNNVV